VLQTFRENDAELDRAKAQAKIEGVDLRDEDQAKAFWKRYPGGKPDFYSKLGTTMFFLRPISRVRRRSSANCRRTWRLASASTWAGRDSVPSH
jgi:hypothetical protein